MDTFLIKIKNFINESNNYKYKDTNHLPYNSLNEFKHPIFSKENIKCNKYTRSDFYYYNNIYMSFKFRDDKFKYSLIIDNDENYINFTAIVNTHITSYANVYFFRDLFEAELYKFLYNFLNSKMQSQQLFDFEKKQELDSINFENYIPPEYLEKFRKEKK